jgi:regulatory protein
VARAIALRQLTLGPRTRAQLAEVLTRRGVHNQVTSTILDRFEQVQLIDDEEFARQWVQTRHSGRGLARKALAHELSRRGVDGELVREAVDEISTDDELATARALVRRRLPAVRRDDPARRTQRLASMLARKSYGAGVAYQAIREVCAESELDDAEDVVPGLVDDATPDADGGWSGALD